MKKNSKKALEKEKCKSDKKMKTVFVKIPEFRVGALIGKEGNTKKELERITDCQIIVDSQSGEVELTAKENAKVNPVVFYKLELVIKAIGRGFAPEKAQLLLDDNTTLIIINLEDIYIKTKKLMTTKKGRVIGTDGQVRKFLEDMLDCFVSVQGKTISIIGKTNDARICHAAIMRLLNGANIQSVKNYIQKLVKEGTQDFEYDEDAEKEKDILD